MRRTRRGGPRAGQHSTRTSAISAALPNSLAPVREHAAEADRAGRARGRHVIDGVAQHSICSLVHLFGIKSPGLTCALSARGGNCGLSVGLSPLALVGAGRRRLRLFDRRRCRPFRGGLNLRLGELAAQVEPGVTAHCCRPSHRRSGGVSPGRNVGSIGNQPY